MKRALIFFLGILAPVFLAGCKTNYFSGSAPKPSNPAVTAGKAVAAPANFTTVTVTNAADDSLSTQPSELFTLGPGDRLDVEIVGDPTTLTAAVVGPDGKIYFNLLPGVDVWGRTIPETRELIEKGMSQFVREAPKISVTLRDVESQRVWLLGRLNTPGIYPMNGPMTLLEALTTAGGPVSPASMAASGNVASGVGFSSDFADLHRSFLIRGGKIVPVDFYRLLKEGDLTQNIYLQPDDFVYVPSAVTREVSVLGAVLQPKLVSYRERMSLVAAIANANGTIKDAYLSHVAIVRGSLSQPTIAVVDFKEIVTGKSPDVLLEPGDIVYVPFSPYRTLERYANLILNTFVSTVAINEGARATTRNFTPVGVSIGGLSQ